MNQSAKCSHDRHHSCTGTMRGNVKCECECHQAKTVQELVSSDISNGAAPALATNQAISELAAAEEAQATEHAKPADFMAFIGGSFYTKESFIAEAERMGISRRMPTHRLPTDLVSGKSRVYVACGGQRKADGEEHPAEIFGYFTPSRVEFIAGDNGKFYADVISALQLRPDSKIIDTIQGEDERGCGQRKEGGTYLVVDKADSPLFVLDPSVPYIGNHFRGLMRLKPEQARAINVGDGISVLVDEECTRCAKPIKVSPDSHARIERERRRAEKGEVPQWDLNCSDCRKEVRAEKRAAKLAAETVATQEVA